jgi:hypothetical protein
VGATVRDEPWLLFRSFLILYSDYLFDVSARRKTATYTGQHKQNKRRLSTMPQVEFEPTAPVFERANIVHALGRAATVLGLRA